MSATTSNAPLRRRLLGVLGFLVTTAVVCSVVPRGPAAALATTRQQVTPAIPAVMPSPAATQSAMPSARPSGSTPAPVAPLRVGGGCGFALGAAYEGASTAGHCTVLEIGDSLGSDLGWGIAREAEPASGLAFVQLDKSSTGLAVPSFYDWPAELAKALWRYRPQLVVICLGGNDQQGMEVNGSPVQFATTAWRAAYIARVHSLAQEATQSGAFVLWIGLPVMAQRGYDRGTQELDADFQAGMQGLPGAIFLPLRSLFASPSGAYLSSAVVDGVRTGLRQSDGIHLSYEGENIAATYVLQHISAVYDVRLGLMAPAVIARQG